MEHLARSVKQIAAILRRIRLQKGLTQTELGGKIHLRQATISKLEAGEPATQLQTLIDVLTALNLELVIRPRTSSTVKDIEAMFSETME